MQQQQQFQSDESHWEDFYAAHLPPSDFEDNRSLLKEFCDRHNKIKSNIVLVTVSRIHVFFSVKFLIIRFDFVAAGHSLVVQQFHSNTIPFDLLIILVQAHEDPRRPNIF